MNITCRLQANAKPSTLLPFHAFKSNLFQSSCIPKTWIHEVKKQAQFHPAPPILCQATLCCLTGKWAQNQKDRGVPAEQSCSWRISPWPQRDTSLNSLLTTAEHYCSLSSHLF